jgi:hypothetical protein
MQSEGNDMKNILGWTAFAITALMLLNGNRVFNHRAIAADRAEDAVRAAAIQLGFSGYAFGDSQQFILDDMAAAGFEAREILDGAIWYETELLDYPIQLGYVFTNDQLVGGAWVIYQATDRAFLEVDEFLREIYGGKIEVTVEGAVTVQVHQSVDALILHTLDRDALTHEVAYMEIE